jgi:hypothetical protein
MQDRFRSTLLACSCVLYIFVTFALVPVGMVLLDFKHPVSYPLGRVSSNLAVEIAGYEARYAPTGGRMLASDLRSDP